MANLKNLRLIPANQFFCLILTWFGLAGLTIYIVGLYGRLNPLNIALICLFPLVLLLLYACYLISCILRFNFTQKLLVALIFCQVALYSLGLFVPETGFDALWYHLPEALHYARSGSVTSLPGLIYSTMPRLGEMYYAAAFFTHSLVFVKLVSFLFALFLNLESYFLSRFFLSRSHSLLVTLTVNSLYLVAWQASSAYVDLPRAVFELGALLCLLLLFSNRDFIFRHPSSVIRNLSLSAILMGFALSVKMQAFIGLIALIVFLAFALWRSRVPVIKIILHTSYVIILVIFIASPWYLDNYLQSGHPLYPANLPDKQLDQLTHAGAASLSDWLTQRLTRLPLIFYDLGTKPYYQLSPIILILFPFLLFRLKFIVSDSKILPLILLALTSLLFWWFLPPAESRYLLPALPPLIILLFYSVFSLPLKYSSIKQISLIFIFLSLALNFALRAAASRKYLPVILGRQSPEDYLSSQTTDFNQSIVDKFYGNFWHNYNYP